MENTFNNAGSTSVEYFINKPSNLTNQQWLFCRSNPYYFNFWVNVLIYTVHGLSLLRTFTFCSLEYLANKVGKSSRTVRDVLKQLVSIGVLDLRIIKKNKQYKVNWGLLRSRKMPIGYYNSNYIETSAITSAIFDENFPESPFDLIDYKDDFLPNIRECNIYIGSDHHDDHLSDSKEIFVESDKQEKLITLAPLEKEIKQEFETITGTTLNLQKNKKALAELKEIASHTKDIVVLAFKNVAKHVAKTNTKIYNLGYVVAAAKNILVNPNKGSEPKKHSAEAEALVGGSSSKVPAVELSEEEKAKKAKETEQKRKAVETDLKHEALRTEFYEDLPQEVKDNLIQQELTSLKKEPFWDKIKPKFPYFDDKPARRHAIERIKDYLLQEYLEYEAFLAIEHSG